MNHTWNSFAQWVVTLFTYEYYLMDTAIGEAHRSLPQLESGKRGGV